MPTPIVPSLDGALDGLPVDLDGRVAAQNGKREYCSGG